MARHIVSDDQRWVDNLLSRFPLPGIDSAGKGSSRRISALGIYHVVLVSNLASSAGLPIEAACRLAGRLLDPESTTAVELFPGAEVRFDRDAFVAAVDARIREAVETIAVPRRGRPPNDA